MTQKRLSLRDVKKLKVGDLIRFDLSQNDVHMFADALILERRESIVDFLGDDPGPGLVLLALNRNQRWHFKYEVIVKEFKTYLLSRV